MQLTPRSRIGSVVAVFGALAISCQGSSGCVTPTETYSPPVLLARYVLVKVQRPNGSAVDIPAIYDDSAGFQLRVDADTLSFSMDSTYREVGQTTLVSSAGGETVRPQATGAPAPRYSMNGSAGSLNLPSFMGRPAAANYYAQQLTVITNVGPTAYGGPIFYFEAR